MNISQELLETLDKIDEIGNRARQDYIVGVFHSRRDMSPTDRQKHSRGVAQANFTRHKEWWTSMSTEDQESYLKDHPNSKLKKDSQSKIKKMSDYKIRSPEDLELLDLIKDVTNRTNQVTQGDDISDTSDTLTDNKQTKIDRYNDIRNFLDNLYDKGVSCNNDNDDFKDTFETIRNHLELNSKELTKVGGYITKSFSNRTGLPGFVVQKVYEYKGKKYLYLRIEDNSESIIPYSDSDSLEQLAYFNIEQSPGKKPSLLSRMFGSGGRFYKEPGESYHPDGSDDPEYQEYLRQQQQPSRSSRVLDALGSMAAGAAGGYIASRASRGKKIIGTKSLGPGSAMVYFDDDSCRQVQGDVTGYTSDSFTTSHGGGINIIHSADGRHRRQIF